MDPSFSTVANRPMHSLRVLSHPLRSFVDGVGIFTKAKPAAHETCVCPRNLHIRSLASSGFPKYQSRLEAVKKLAAGSR